MELNLTALDDLVKKAEQLKQLLGETSQIIEVKKMPRDGTPILASLPDNYRVQMEVLVTARQAAKILKVNVNTVNDYAHRGLLAAIETPPASNMKFMVSDLNAFIRGLPQHHILKK